MMEQKKAYIVVLGNGNVRACYTNYELAIRIREMLEKSNIRAWVEEIRLVEFIEQEPPT